MAAKYKRVLIKLSGEALAQGVTVAEGEKKPIINYEFLKTVCEKIKKCIDLGVEVAIVVGAGNIWRGKEGKNFERVRADHMGMLATVINCLAMQDALIRQGQKAITMSAQPMEAFAETYTKRGAIKAMEEGNVVLFAAGSGCPYFSTDTAAVLRAAEIEADAALFAKNIDGVYDSDPKLNPNAKRFTTIDYGDIFKMNLKAIDLTAAAFCMDAGMKVFVFALDDPDNIKRAINGENIGTLIYKGETK